MKTGCYTALITPFATDGELDIYGLDQLIAFQVENRITGILAAGTTGESPTLKWEEHNRLVAEVAAGCKGKCFCIAGAGSNNTDETLEGVRHASAAGVDAVLLVDPYYNGPSSLEIRKEYYEPVARAYPDMEIVPYIIPGRTGAQLFPEDLAILARECPNFASVKEATGNMDNIRRTRECCGPDFKIFSGDDGIIFDIMKDPAIMASGGISVMSNIVPGALADMVMFLDQKQMDEAEKLHAALKPLLDIVMVVTQEETPFGRVSCRARNPLALKTLMQLFGMPSGDCRRPMGKMTAQGLDVVISAAKQVQQANPEIFRPLASFFNVDIDERLNDPVFRNGLYYEAV